MKKIISITLLTTILFLANITKAQTAQQINGLDCNGVAHDLFADLDAGKAVVVFFLCRHVAHAHLLQCKYKQWQTISWYSIRE
ncbi:MAG: hypothetical protein IPH46_01640 [Bacteroidetes bacterium]|nr:hypothetical protein [Bacteroidota bacterium]